MKWSTRIGRFAGIDVYVHATFLMLIAWVGVTLSVSLDLTASVRARRRALRELTATFADPKMHRMVVLPSDPRQEPSPAEPIEPSGMIVLPPQDRDPQWRQARLQQSGQFHVDRDLWPLTDCPAGHYDYHELRSGSLDQAVRRCAWCPPSAGTWTEGLVGSKDSER